MTGKQQLFVEYYLGTANANASKAARLAGYANPRVSGCNLLKRPEIRALVQARLNVVAMEANEVLEQLTAHARGSMADFISFDEHGEPFVDLQKGSVAGKLPLVKRIGNRGGAWEIELYDAQSALVQLGKYHRLFIDKIETTSEITAVSIEYVNDWKGV